MPSFADQLAQSLFQKDKLEHCSVQELQQAVDRYPYFSAAHLLLCKKLQQEDPAQFAGQLQRTSVFFPNITWLEHLLFNTGAAEHFASESSQETRSSIDLPRKEIADPEQKTIAESGIEIKTDSGDIPVTGDVSNYQEEEPRTYQDKENEDPILIAPLKIETIDPSKATFSFAPLYTVDYFASQGIRFKEEEKPKDKFGQQLKSFTEWLKTLKTSPVTEITKKIEPVAEQKIEIMAGESIQDRDVVTEAMAEVWEKQGNHDKALEIYNKLSLLEPDKSSYFATKIEALKKTE